MRYIEDHPDLIWLDVYLPGMNGDMFLKKIKDREDAKNIPVIVVTCSQGVGSRINTSFADNIEGYFVKSDIRLEKIISKIKELVPV